MSQFQETVIDIFYKRVEENPLATAGFWKNETITYQQLDIWSEQICNKLYNEGVRANSIVAIMVERSFAMMAAILGVLKLGAAYLPIGLDNPCERIKSMISFSAPDILLINGNHQEWMDDIGVKVLDIALIDDTFEKRVIKRPTINDLCYVIFTSGSTGEPKGVMIKHKSVINRLLWMKNQYCIGENDVILQKTPITFDVSVWELFVWIISNAKICFLPANEESNAYTIISTIYEKKVTICHFVPSMLSHFLKYVDSNNVSKLDTLRHVICSGEELTVGLKKKFDTAIQNNKICLHNLYGPTEATVDVSFYDCSDWKYGERIPIGKPIDNVNLLVLNDELICQDNELEGILYISGDCLAEGYINDPEKTYDSFIVHNNIRMYMTGDICKFNKNGELEYVGRDDYQVKIKGVRIEIGEIEHFLRKNQEVEQTAVIVIEEDDLKSLVAYVVSNNEVRSIRDELKKYLPRNIIPTYIRKIDRMPLTKHGKIDRYKLYQYEKLLRNNNQ